MLSLGATRTVGDATSYFVAYRNGTGRVTFLQSTIPSLSYACFDYVPVASDRAYSKTFSQILRKQTYDEDDYDPTTFLSERESFLREIFDRHCVYLACKDQGGDDWRFLRCFTITSTLCHVILPRVKQMLNEEHIDLLENGLGLALKDEAEIDADDMWQHTSIEELKTLGNEQLKTICKKYGRPYSNKRKDQLIETIRQGPKEDLSITEAEKIIKYSF
jgi:hypothetical protein